MNPLKVGRWLPRLRELVRWREWYDSKLPLVLAALCYATLRSEAPGGVELARMAALFGLIGLYAAFGHIVNDYADRAADRLAGKRKVLAGMSEPAALAAMALPAAGALAIAIAWFDTATLALTLLALLLAAGYSLPPARFKERGYLGWITAALAQRTLPLALVFQALAAWDLAAALLTLLATLIGLRYIIVHQLHDRANDLRAGLRTVATQRDPEAIRRLLSRAVFLAEIACALATVAAMARHEPLLLVPALAFAASLPLLHRRGKPLVAESYDALAGFYDVIWPVTLALLLAAREPLFLPVVLVALALGLQKARRRLRAALAPPVRARKAPAPTARPAVATQAPARPIEVDLADPYPLYTRLREEAPLHWLDWPGLGRVWMVTRHAEALALFKDPRFVKNAANVEPAPGEARRAEGPPMRGFGRDMVELDPPDHTRLRSLASRSFTPQRVERLSGRVAELAGELLERARPRGEIELISQYAAVIPITVICELLGVPIDDVERFRLLIYGLSLGELPGRSAAELQAEKAFFTRHLESVFALRRAAPQDDLVSALVQAEQDGDRLSASELIGMVYLLMLGGFLTTAHLIGNGTLALLRNPEQLERFRQTPALDATAYDELLRYDSPLVASSVHYAATDVALGGQTVPRGAPIRVLIPAVNRDPVRFDQPDRLDLARSPCPHLSFGQGIHFCLGRPLARLEGRIALRQLADRLPGLRLASDAAPQWLGHPVLRGLQRLPLRF